MKSRPLVLLLLLCTALPAAIGKTLACPDLRQAVQVGTCPSDEELRYTFTGYCSDDAKAYKGETDVCTDFQRYRQLKNVALWESADGAFDAYVPCDLTSDAVKQAGLARITVGKQGSLTQLVCSYANGTRFTHRTRALCTVDTNTATATCP